MLILIRLVSIVKVGKTKDKRQKTYVRRLGGTAFCMFAECLVVARGLLGLLAFPFSADLLG
jgi:hypothetical protein